MFSDEDILDTSNLHLEGDFDAQVGELLSAVRLTRSEVEDLQRLIYDLEATLSKPWPGCKVHPFGSIVTGLGIRTSDVDCYVSLPRWVKINNQLVFKAKSFLSAQPVIYSELCAIPNAKVPIVKFCHEPTNRNCDVNFKSRAGVQNSKLLAYLLHVDSRALPLAILIKYWSKVHNLTGTNLVPNYALTLLVIFYLQLKRMLPSIHSLQTCVQKYIVDGWNTAFAELDYTPDIETSDGLYSLLGGFFDFYSSFDFKNQIVCPYLGSAIPKESFSVFERVPEQYGLYKTNIIAQVCEPLRVNTSLCVQDPFEHSRNCSVAVHQRLFNKVLTYFKGSARHFHEVESERYLKAILTKVQYKEERVDTRNYHQQRIINHQQHKNNQQQQGRHQEKKNNYRNRVQKRKMNFNNAQQNVKYNLQALYLQYRNKRR